VKDGWKDAKLGEIFEIGSSKRVLQKEWQREGVPFYRAREIVKLAKDGSVENDLFISEDHFAELKDKHGVPIAGDLMVSAVGTLGACYVVQPDDRFYFKDASVLRFHPKVKVDSRFYQYAFKWDGLLDTVKKSDGATVGTLTISRAKGIPVPLPPLEEQQRIVAVLDEAFEGLARARAHAEANLQNARELFESARQIAVSPPDNAEGWLVTKLGDAATLQRGFDLPKAQRTAGQFPLVTSSGATDTHNVAKVKGPGVATGRSGSIGNVFFIEDDFWPLNTALYVKDFHGNFPKYVFYLLKQFDLSRFASGAGVPTLNRNDVHDELVTVPISYEKQKEIVSQIDGVFEASKGIEQTYTAKLQDIGDLRQSLLQKAFAGELT
jgi:type I restriction enzyme S subunit